MSIAEIHFPTMLPSDPLRRRLLVGAGRLARRVFPEQAERAARGELPGELGLWQRVLLAPTVDDAERSGDLAALAPLHRWLWSSGQAHAFHEEARERFSRWWRADRHAAIVGPLREALEAGRFSTLCEVGTGNGLVLTALAAQLPFLRRLVGLDLSEAQMARNRAEAKDPRLSFEVADAAVWLPAHAEPGWAVLTNAGVFEYFAQAQVAALFEGLAARSPSCLALIEPLAEGFDPERAVASRPYNAEKSFSHPYVAMLQSAGFRVRWRAEQRFDGVRWLLVVATAS